MTLLVLGYFFEKKLDTFLEVSPIQIKNGAMTYVKSNPKTGSAIIHNIIITKPFIAEKIYANLRIICEVSKEYLQIVYAEDAAVADFATFAGGKYFYVPPTSVKIVA